MLELAEWMVMEMPKIECYRGSKSANCGEGNKHPSCKGNKRLEATRGMMESTQRNNLRGSQENFPKAMLG